MTIPVEYKPSGGVLIARWKMDAVDDGEAIQVAEYADKSYGMYAGDAGWGGATVVLQGSWDFDNSPPKENTWVSLYESDNTTAISLTANAGGVVLENPLWIRAKRTAGTGGQTVNVVIVGKNS